MMSGSGRGGSSASLGGDSMSLSEALAAGGYSLPWRQPLWMWAGPARRGDRAWLCGALFVLVLVATLPLSFLCMSMLTLAAIATCLRAFALHQYSQRLSELADQAGAASEDDDSGGSTSGAAGALSSAAQRRPRRPSLLTAVAAAGRPFNLLHLRLSLVDRDFTEPGDYELLLRLDDMEAGGPPAQREAVAAVPESQLALLPVHVHRTPTKKARAQRATPFEGSQPATPAAAAAPVAPPTPAAPAAPLAPHPATPTVVPVLEGVRPRPQPQWALPAPPAADAVPPARAGFRAVRAAGGWPLADAREEIAPAPAQPQPDSDPGSEEDDEILCSVCLEPFDDGAKILSLPCRHQFHEGCVRRWLLYKGADATCPNCKSEVFTPRAQPTQQPR